jgi:acyl carrier protein
MPTIPLLELIAGTLGVGPAEITEASTADSTRRWDSLRHIMLMTEIETNYGIELSEQEMSETTSVRRIRELLARHGVSA